jgi:hypothetical protein
MKSPLTRSLCKQTPMKIERFHMTLKKQILSTYEKNSFAFRKTAARILPTSCRADFDKHYQYAAKPDG